ncbi:MAG TPA: FUSC family protein [Actinomycetes bacterium]|nr:FUSC family protein [Actinomycetes bacterium]
MASTASTQSDSPRMGQVLVRRTVISLAVVVVVAVPYVLFALLSGQWAAASWTMMGGITGLVGLLLGGRVVAYLGMGLLAVLTPLSILAGGVPVLGAALMALMCVGVGLSAARGLSRGTLMLPVLMASMLIAPPSWSGQTVDRTTPSYLLWMTLFLAGGALWANLVFPRLLRGRAPSRAAASNRSDIVAYTVIITVLCAFSTLGVLIWRPGSQGSWLVVTLLVVTEVGHQDTLNRAWRRVIGTVGGALIASIIASNTDSELALLTIGVILLVIAGVIRQGPHYGLYMAFMTPAVVLFSSSSIATVGKTDAQRVAFTLIGAALVLLASGIAVAWAHYQQTHPEPDAGQYAAVNP